jgi:hypothetical protein
VTGPVGAVGLGADRGVIVVSVETVMVVFECPGCGERVLERRCGDCGVFRRRPGPGGGCPGCGEIVLVAELEGEL